MHIWSQTYVHTYIHACHATHEHNNYLSPQLVIMHAFISHQREKVNDKDDGEISEVSWLFTMRVIYMRSA